MDTSSIHPILNRAVHFACFLICLWCIAAGLNVLSQETALGSEGGTAYIIFLGGGDAYEAAEHSQYLQFKQWQDWALSRTTLKQESPSQSRVIAIYADGARSENGKDVFEPAREPVAWHTPTTQPSSTTPANEDLGDTMRPIPNIRKRENGKTEYLRVNVRGNYGPAELPTLERALAESANSDELFFFFGDHGQEFTPEIWNEDDKAGARVIGIDKGFKARESFIIGWHGGQSSSDLSWVNRRYNGHHPAFIATSQLRNILDKAAPEKPIRFVATYCFSGGLAWLAFDDNQKHLRGNICGIMGSTYYQSSSGCDPDPSAQYGYGYWVSQAIERHIDLDGDGKTSLSEAHWYAFAHDRLDVTPQLTTEVFLQERGYLKWPIDPRKHLHEKREVLDKKNASVKPGKSELILQCSDPRKTFLPDPLQQLQGTTASLDKTSTTISSWLAKQEQSATTRPTEPHPSDSQPAQSQLTDLLADRPSAQRRLKEYLAAEMRFLSEASKEDRETYLKVRTCEAKPL